MKFEAEKKAALEAVTAASRFCVKVQNAALDRPHLTKPDRTPATVADFGSQAVIAKILMSALPGARIMAEERSGDLLKGENSGLQHTLKRCINDFFNPDAGLKDIYGWIDAGSSNTGDSYWVVDPIDGTKGFLRGGQYAVALALVVMGKVELGFLGCPGLPYDEAKKGSLFMAGRGCGAVQLWLNDLNVRKKITVRSERTTTCSSRFVESVESEHADQDIHMEISKRMGIKEPPLRIDSQAKYAVVARGEAAAYLRIQSRYNQAYRQKAWDHAAGSIIVEEAGGTVTDSLGKALDFRSGSTLDHNTGVVASNGIHHGAIIGHVRDVINEADNRSPRK